MMKKLITSPWGPVIFMALLIALFSTVLPAQGGFPKSNPSSLTGGYVVVQHNSGTTGVLLDSLNNKKITPAGSNTEIQFNNSGVFGASSLLTYTSADSSISVNGVKIWKGRWSKSGNIAVGNTLTLGSITTGNSNIAIGNSNLKNNTLGNNNVAIGLSAGELTTGSSNISVGTASMANSTIGSNNIGIGTYAGRYITGGITLNDTTNNSIYIGYDSRANGKNQTNQIVIGHNVTGLGSNTAVIGKSMSKVRLGDNLTFKADQSIGAGQDNYVLTYDHAVGTVSLEAPVVDNLGNHTATTNLAMAQYNIENTNKITSDTVATTNITNLSKAESPTGGTAKSRIIMGTALSIPTSIRTENTANANQYGQLAVDADGITSLIQVNGSKEAGLKIEADSIVNLYTSGNNSLGFVSDTAKIITNNITAIKVGPTGKVEIKDYLLAETTASPAQAEKFAILPVDCSGGAKTVTPPASPVAGDWFAVSDSRANAGTNNITVDTSGDKLHGGANDYIMNANADYVRFTYVNATIGWIKSN